MASVARAHPRVRCGCLRCLGIGCPRTPYGQVWTDKSPYYSGPWFAPGETLPHVRSDHGRSGSMVDRQTPHFDFGIVPERFQSVNILTLESFTPHQQTRAKSMILICIRGARILQLFMDHGKPFMFETVAFKYVGQTSVFNLDEYIALRSNKDVTLHNAVQCPYGALSSKLTSWLFYKLDVANMPAVCTCPRVAWFSNKNNYMIYAKHPPTYGDITYSRTRNPPQQLRA